MEDKRTALAVIISILVILAYQKYLGDQKRYEQALFNAKNPAARQVIDPASNESSEESTSTSFQPNQQLQNTGASAQLKAATSSLPSDEELHSAPQTFIESSVAQIAINHLGARISSFQLRNFKVSVDSDQLLDLVSHQSGEPLPLAVYFSSFNDHRVLYTLERSMGLSNTPDSANRFVIQGAESELVFLGTFPNGAQIRKIFTFDPNSYLFKVKVQLTPSPEAGLPVWLEWDSFVPEAIANERYNLHQFKVLNAQNKVTSILPTDVKKGLSDYGKNQWASFSDTYFMSALVPIGSGGDTKIGKEKETYIARVASENDKGEFAVFLGPKLHNDLEKLSLQLEKNVDLGWFSFLAHPLLSLLRFFYSLLGNWGLAIISLTLVIKLALLPLTQASFKSMKAMQDIQPEIKVLRERVKDPTELNQETLALYKKRGVNPVGGCLPMMLQIPVFLGLYNALLNAMELRHAPFALWITDLASPERLEIFGIGVPVMILIMGVTMFVQQWTTPTTADPAQKKAMMLMPFMFTGMFIIFPFPSGLVLYWLVNNLISIVQQVYLRGSSKASPLQATIIASVAIFGLGYIVTLL
jgi:YidC/Oxa1 family membrane protein insertase